MSTKNQNIITIIIVSVLSLLVIASTGITIYLGKLNAPHPDGDWSFKISGNIIGDEFNITMDELTAMPSYKKDYVMQGDDLYIAEFQGVQISYLLDNIIDVNPSATTIAFIAFDTYQIPFQLSTLLQYQSVILAYKKNGQYLESYQDGGIGYLRLIIPQEMVEFNAQMCLKGVVEIRFS